MPSVEQYTRVMTEGIYQTMATFQTTLNSPASQLGTQIAATRSGILLPRDSRRYIWEVFEYELDKYAIDLELGAV
jgi:hypothetical protein